MRLSILAIMVLLLGAGGEILQIQILHRHGARPPLNKHESRPGQARNNSSPLLRGGLEQLEILGRAVVKTYVHADSEKHVRGLEAEQLHGRQVESWSSNFMRTLQSARGFLQAFERTGVVIGTRMFGNDTNDWVIRGYGICPKLREDVEEFLNGDEVAKREKEDGEFVRRVARGIEGQDGDFGEVYNVYDKYLNLRNGGWGGMGKEGEVKGKELNEVDFKRLKNVTDWVESGKFGGKNVEVGSGLLEEIVRNMHRIVDRRHGVPEIVEYSVHYPTLLGLWMGLRGGEGKLRYPADRIPGFGAAMIFELHKEGEKYIVKIVWFEGDLKWIEGEIEEKVVFEDVGIDRGGCDINGCEFDMFRKLVGGGEGEGEKEGGKGKGKGKRKGKGRGRFKKKFCEGCESKSLVCRENVGMGSKVGAGFIGGFIGLVGGIVICIFYSYGSARRKRRGVTGIGGLGAICNEEDGDINP